MRPRLILILLTAFTLFIAVGCADARYHLTVNRDGSGDIDLRVTFDDITRGWLGRLAADPMVNLARALEKDGYSVATNEGRGRSELAAQKHVDELLPQNLGLGKAMTPALAAAEQSPLQIKRGFFQTSYQFEADIDPLEIISGEQLSSLESYLFQQMEFTLLLTLPLQPDQHNAQGTADEGRTLLWQLIPGQDNRVQVTASHWNPGGLAFTALGVILFAAGLIWVLARNREEN